MADTSDEEALDGFHASEPTYGRIVLQVESDSVIAHISIRNH